MKNTLRIAGILSVLTLFFHIPAVAATSTWIASGGGSWTNNSNWDTAPVDGDLVVFNLSGGGTVTVTDVPGITLERLTVNNTGSTVLVLQSGTAATLVINDPMDDNTTDDVVVGSDGALTIGLNLSLDMTSSSNLRGSVTGTLNIGSGGLLNMSVVECIFTGAGTVNVNSGGMIITGSEYGLTNLTPGSTAGNIQTTTRTFGSSANYIYSPAVSGVTGNALPSSVADFTLSSDGNALTLSQALTVTGTLTLTAGTLSIGANTLTIDGAISSASGSLSGGSTSNITVAGSGSGTTLPAISLNTLILNRSSGISLGGNVTVSTTLNLTSGAVTIGANTLTVNGAISTTSGSLSGGSTSNITVGGSGSNTTLPSVSLNNLTIGRSNGITLGGAVTVAGTLTLTSGALSIGANTLTINGDLSIGSGSLTGGTTSNLSIGGSGSNLTLPAISGNVNALIINRSNGVTLGANLTAGGSLTFTSGILNTGAFVLTHGITSLPSVSRTSGYCMGTMARYCTATTGNRAFPMGNSTSYRLVTVNYTVAPTSAGLLTVSYVDGSGSTSLNPTLTDGSYTLDTRSMLYISVSYSGGLAGGTFTLNIDGNGGLGSSGTPNPTFMRIIRSTDNGATFEVVGTHSNGSGTTAIRTGLTPTAARYYIASMSSDNPLPVELGGFTLRNGRRTVMLDWATASESNNAGFEIWRSDGGSDYLRISSYGDNAGLRGLGSSPVGKPYSFTDRELEPGLYSYRLVDVALDGRRTEHPAQSIELAEDREEAALLVYPNPAQTELVISSPDRILSAEIISATGEVYRLDANGTTLRIDMSAFAPGVYSVRTITDEGLRYGRFTLLR